MIAKRSWKERAEELLNDLKKRRSVREWVQWHLEMENWETWIRKGVQMAAREVGRRKWRGEGGGVLPDGYDAESLASEAIKELLHGHPHLAPGFTPERLGRELERLIRQKVRLLHRRKETSALRSEWEVTSADGEEVSMLEQVEAGAAGPSQEEQELRERIEERLAGEPELRNVFDCLCLGLRDPARIGQRLGLGEKAVLRARRRLKRCLARLGNEPKLIREFH